MGPWALAEKATKANDLGSGGLNIQYKHYCLAAPLAMYMEKSATHRGLTRTQDRAAGRPAELMAFPAATGPRLSAAGWAPSTCTTLQAGSLLQRAGPGTGLAFKEQDEGLRAAQPLAGWPLLPGDRGHRGKPVEPNATCPAGLRNHFTPASVSFQSGNALLQWPPLLPLPPTASWDPVQPSVSSKGVSSLQAKATAGSVCISPRAPAQSGRRTISANLMEKQKHCAPVSALA